MIQQFAELGAFYRQKEGVGGRPEDRLAQFAQDPAQKFRTETVLLLVFSDTGFERVEVEEYDATKRLDYLYRTGPPNRWDATPTTGLPPVKGGAEGEYDAAVRRKLLRLSRSTAAAADSTLPEWEKVALDSMRDQLKNGVQECDAIVNAVKDGHPASSHTGAILSVAWQRKGGIPTRVGGFEAFRKALIHSGEHAASSKKGVSAEVKGFGQCCICGSKDTEVFGLLQVPNFKLYTLDKRGSVSGGFNELEAWRNFPACQQCCENVDFAGERVKKHLAFDYYSSFKYLFLPLPLRQQPTVAYQLLDRLISFRLNSTAQKRLTDAENELFFAVAELEDTLLQVDLLFYQPDPQSFRPALYVSGLLPSRFAALFAAKDRVDSHPWLQSPSPKAFTQSAFSFGSMSRVFPHAHSGSRFDDDFLTATRAALERRAFSLTTLLRGGMRWVRQDYLDGGAWQSRLADLFRTILFFDEVTDRAGQRSNATMDLDYGRSPQADRVRAVLRSVSGRLKSEPAAQAAFLVGACCSRVESMQLHARGSSPFEGKLKGFRLSQADVQALFVAAKDKAKAYDESKVAGLLECAAVALAGSPERWSLSPDEVSYFFALGHALRPRFAAETDENGATGGGRQTEQG